ncbi:MAG: hypothetical protein HY081_00300 [Gammaproteobacteria bacterium]|nr:hypothetical protein [Gammaproteobacteria bacterium]
MRILVWFQAATLALTVATPAAGANEADDQKMLRAQRLLRQVSQERDVLQAEVSQLKSQMNDLNQKLVSLKKNSENALARSRESNSVLSANVAQLTLNLRQTESAKNQLQETLTDQAQQIEFCEVNNVKLVQINRELVDRYEKKSAVDALLQREPLTQLKRVEFENIVQEYQDRIEQLTFKQKTISSQ